MKRRIKLNRWDNWEGYEGTCKTQLFGTQEDVAREWLRTGERPVFDKAALIRLMQKVTRK